MHARRTEKKPWILLISTKFVVLFSHFSSHCVYSLGLAGHKFGKNFTVDILLPLRWMGGLKWTQWIRFKFERMTPKTSFGTYKFGTSFYCLALPSSPPPPLLLLLLLYSHCIKYMCTLNTVHLTTPHHTTSINSTFAHLTLKQWTRLTCFATNGPFIRWTRFCTWKTVEYKNNAIYWNCDAFGMKANSVHTH